MKRLSVRFSVIGAVLILGGSAIAYQMLSGSDPQAEPAEPPPQVAQAEAPDAERPPTPIRAAGESGDEQSPATFDQSSSETFDRENSLRNAAYQSAADATTDSQTADPTAISAPVGTGGGFPLPSTTGVAHDNLPEAVADSSSDAFPAPPVTTPPPAPGYGMPADTAAMSDETNEDQSAAGLSGLPPAPSTSFPVEGDEAATTPPPTSPADELSDINTSQSASDSYSPAVAVGPLSSDGVPATNSGEKIPADTSMSEIAADTSTPGGYAGELSQPPATPGFTTSSPLADATSEAQPPAAGEVGSSAFATGTGAYAATAGGDPSNQPMTSNESTTTPAATGYAGGQSYASGQSSERIGNTAQPVPDEAAGYVGGSTPPAGNSNGVGTVTPLVGGLSLEAQGVPGDRQLEGQQSPAIVIEKSAPAEIQVNRSATFHVRVQNRGTAPAHNVVVVDRVPDGTRFESANPDVQPTLDGVVVWQLNTVAPGEEVVLSMQVTPQVPGEIGSVARATFQTVASVRTVCTQPKLQLEVKAPQSVLIGQLATLEIKITNVGSGAAENIIVEEDVPEGFAHAAGRELEHQIQTLRPQESRSLTLPLQSVRAGTFENCMLVRAEGDLFVEDRRQIEVTTPQLQVAMNGPSRRYLDRQATYTIQLANPGTAGARSVELATHLPKGMKYVTSDKHGQYDSQSHAVYWSLEELPPNTQGDVTVTVLPIEPGSQKLMTDARAELGLKESCEHEVIVEGVAELSFVISDVADPIEVGSDTTYEVRVHNRGSKPDTKIRLVAVLPQGLIPTTGDGPTQAEVQGQSVYFAPLEKLGPGEEAVYKIHARGGGKGDHVFSAQLQSDELRVPVTKEEITRVYTDN
jgi:uncharacterized repeat protein (TIGR01451 family)